MLCKFAAINLSTEVVKFQREVEQKASHIGSAVCQVILVASARPSYYEAGNKLACMPAGENRELTPGTYAATPDCYATTTADLAARKSANTAHVDSAHGVLIKYPYILAHVNDI